jgi:hypothetical protein
VMQFDGDKTENMTKISNDRVVSLEQLAWP